MRGAEVMQPILEELSMHSFHVIPQLISKVGFGCGFAETTVVWQIT